MWCTHKINYVFKQKLQQRPHGEILSIPSLVYPEAMRCFIALSFQLCFRICNSSGEKKNTITTNIEALSETKGRLV
jgi:hypothetical protein